MKTRKKAAWSNFLMSFLFLFCPVTVVTADVLSVSVNYTEESVWGTAGPSASVSVVLTDGSGTLKASAAVIADGSGKFEITCLDWTPSGCPGIEPGDFVYANDGSTQTSIRVGQIDAETDLDTELVTGNVQAQWLSGSVTVLCYVKNPDVQVETTVDPDGGYFSCDFSAMGRDIQGAETVWVGYVEADGDQVWRSLKRWMEVNYGWDKIIGYASPGSILSMSLKDSQENVKATVLITADSNGLFEISCPDWSCSVCGTCPTCPDIQPGYFIEIIESGVTEIIKVGNIEGILDFNADLVSGTVTAPFTENLKLECCIYEELAPEKQSFVDPQGGNFSFDYNGEYDILPGQWIEVRYHEPDGDRISNVFRGPAPHLVMEDFYAKGNACAGGNLFISINYGNLGDAVAEDSEITLTLQNMTYLSDTSGYTFNTTTVAGGQQVTWDMGSISGDSKTSFQVFVSVDGTVSENLIATGQISTSSPYDQGDSYEKIRTWNGVIEPNNTYLTVSSDSWTPDPTPGGDFVLEVKVCNTGETSSSEVTLHDLFPNKAITSFVYWWGDNAGWKELSSSDEELTIAVPTIAGGACNSIYLAFHVSHLAETGMNLVNTTQVSATGDLSGGAETVKELVIAESHANLMIQKSWQNGCLTPCGNLYYKIEFGNTGNLPVQGFLNQDGDPMVLAIIDIFPVHTSFVEAQLVNNGSSTPLTPLMVNDEFAVFAFTDLENGFKGQLEVRLQIDYDALPQTLLVNRAEIGFFNTVDAEFLTAAIDEDTYEDNISIDTQMVYDHGPNLRIFKQHEWLSEYQGLSYTIRFENVGDIPVNNVVIHDTYPEGTTFNEEFRSDPTEIIIGFTHDPDVNLIEWTVETFDPGQTGLIYYLLTLNDPTDIPRLYPNMLEILPSEDTNPADNFYTDEAISKEIGSVHVKLDEHIVLGTVVPGNAVTVETPHGQFQAETWECSEGHFYPDDVSLGGCWAVNIGNIDPGDYVWIDTNHHSVKIIIPDPFEAYASFVSNIVLGHIDNLDAEYIQILVGLGPDVLVSTEVQTDNSGNYSAEFIDISPSYWAEVLYTAYNDYARVTFHRLVMSGNDSDDDDITDDQDNCPYVANPDQADYEGDGYGDVCDPDDDNDKMPDYWEELNSLNPFMNDANEDPDEDGFNNLIEYKRGTNPQDSTSHPSRSMPWLPLLLEE